LQPGNGHRFLIKSRLSNDAMMHSSFELDHDFFTPQCHMTRRFDELPVELFRLHPLATL
jgi:hypothetical protein